MRAALHPFLPNGPSGDPVVHLDLLDEDHSLLLDLGDLRSVPNRKLLRVRRALVSHTHLDHFFGFDQLLRVSLVRDREVALIGPPGFTDNVAGKLRGYAWNLIEDYPIRLLVEEIDGESIRGTVFAGASGLRPEPQPERPFGGTVEARPSYRIDAAVLDHGIPVLGFAIREVEHLSVDKGRLAALGLVPGPWLSKLKEAVRADVAGGEEIEARAIGGSTKRFPLHAIAADLLRRSAGQQIGYLADLRFTAANVERAVALVRGVQLLICEAAFLDRDRELARERNHLTARQAGELARAAGAQRLAPFHFSSRYEGDEDSLFDEAAAAFDGPVVRLPRGPEARTA